MDTIALYGKTCSLKTEVAQELSGLTGFKLTNRGEIATTRAKYSRLPTAASLPPEEHAKIDAETLAMTRRDERLMIFESAFIDAVLRNVPGVYFVRLYAADPVREERWRRRKEEGGGRTRQLGESVASRDREDEALRRRLYGAADSGVKPVLEIDTSTRPAAEVALQIWEAFEQSSGIQNVVTDKPAMDKSAARGITPGPSGGQVRRFNAQQSPFGGYITDERSGKDIYVHRSALGEGVKDLAQGQRVRFDIVEDGFGGFKAVKVVPVA